MASRERLGRLAQGPLIAEKRRAQRNARRERAEQLYENFTPAQEKGCSPGRRVLLYQCDPSIPSAPQDPEEIPAPPAAPMRGISRVSCVFQFPPLDAEQQRRRQQLANNASDSDDQSTDPSRETGEALDPAQDLAIVRTPSPPSQIVAAPWQVSAPSGLLRPFAIQPGLLPGEMPPVPAQKQLQRLGVWPAHIPGKAPPWPLPPAEPGITQFTVPPRVFPVEAEVVTDDEAEAMVPAPPRWDLRRLNIRPAHIPGAAPPGPLPPVEPRSRGPSMPPGTFPVEEEVATGAAEEEATPQTQTTAAEMLIAFRLPTTRFPDQTRLEDVGTAPAGALRRMAVKPDAFPGGPPGESGNLGSRELSKLRIRTSVFPPSRSADRGVLRKFRLPPRTMPARDRGASGESD